MRLLVACSICFIYVLIICPPIAHASNNSISISELLVEVVDREINIDCSVKYAVDDKVKTALSNGIEISFVLELELKMDREVWPDTAVVKLTREFRLKYHGLSKQYVLFDVQNDIERSFPDLFSAFHHFGRLRNMVLANIDILELDQQYYVRARARLLPEKLPLPLRIKSYFSADWRPSSGWTIWPM